MTLHSIPLQEILLDGPEFDNFIITFPLDITPLKESVQKIGLLNPVWLRQHENGWQIVCGSRRVLTYRELGERQIPAQIVTAADCPVEQALAMSLTDNARRELNPVEKARALQKFHALCHWDFPRLASELAPQLGLPPALEVVQNYLGLLGFERDFQLALADGTLSPAHAFLMIPLSGAERRTIFDKVIQTCLPSLNECREIIDNLVDLKMILKKSIPEILQRQPLAAQLGAPSKNAKEKCRLLRDALRRMRFPQLTSIEDRFVEALSTMSLKSSIQVRHAPYFEGNHLDISFRVNANTEIAAALAQLQAAASNGGFQKLFELVRGGR
jgi:ParB family chromosome partitioning protein